MEKRIDHPIYNAESGVSETSNVSRTIQVDHHLIPIIWNRILVNPVEDEQGLIVSLLASGEPGS